MRTLVVGWGNRIAGDDAVGLAAAEAVASQIARPDVDVITTSLGSFRLAERTLGYDRVLVLDARASDPGDDEAPSIERVSPRRSDQSNGARHDASLVDAFHALRTLRSEELPNELVLISVPIEAPTAWRSEMSIRAKAASRRLADAALSELEEVAVG